MSDGEVPDSHHPESPDNCPCGDCFCRGAIPAKETVDEFTIADLIWHSIEWTRLEVPTPVVLVTQMESTSFLLPFKNSGHNLRAALCCWVI
jgi:hypothetical protein